MFAQLEVPQVDSGHSLQDQKPNFTNIFFTADDLILDWDMYSPLNKPDEAHVARAYWSHDSAFQSQQVVIEIIPIFLDAEGLDLDNGILEQMQADPTNCAVYLRLFLFKKFNLVSSNFQYRKFFSVQLQHLTSKQRRRLRSFSDSHPPRVLELEYPFRESAKTQSLSVGGGNRNRARFQKLLLLGQNRLITSALIFRRHLTLTISDIL